MSGAEGSPPKPGLEALRSQLGLSLQSSSSHSALIPLNNVTPLTLNVDGQEFSVLVPIEAKPAFRQRFKELARREKRRAANAGNAANTSIVVGSSLGGPLATGGVIAFFTLNGPLAVATILLAGAGGLIFVGGLMAGHWMNKKKLAHEENLERYLEVVEEVK